MQRGLEQGKREQVHLVSVGIDPADSIEDLRRFAESRGVAFDTWSFVTGRRENVDRLVELFSSGLFVGEDGQPDHRLAVYLLDREGRNM